MKSPLQKLRKFALHKTDAKDKKDYQPTAHFDDLHRASKDMQDMKNCYDSLLSAAAATANSAYEFSESLQEMGTCLLEKTACHDDGSSGKVLLMLGKVQLELQKLVDTYRSHVILTIANPSESLLTELRKVEEMKLQCDEKREVYEYMAAQLREKGKLKGGKGGSITSQQLQAACDDYDEVARLCVFRVESLKRGQSLSLLTQAARHHSAQLNLFQKGLKSLEAVEPFIRVVTETQHIDHQLSGLVDGEDEEEEGTNSYEKNDDGELNVDYGESKQGSDNLGASKNQMELEYMHPQASKLEDAEMNLSKNQEEQVLSRQAPVNSHSAPILSEKFDPSPKIREMRLPMGKHHAYVLPTPVDARSSTSRASTSVYSSPQSHGGSTHNLWHSSPLETQQKHQKISTDACTSQKGLLTGKETNSTNMSVRLPPPPPEGISASQSDGHNAYDNKKVKIQAYSGPIGAGKPRSTKLSPSASGPITPAELPHLVGFLSRVPIPQPSSSTISHGASPPLVSSPRISELHELPRPPGGASKPQTPSGMIGHSAPLVLGFQEISQSNKRPMLSSSGASPLPTPPLTVPRSYSIPSSSRRYMALHMPKLLESRQIPEKDEGPSSPPLTPMSLSNRKSLSSVSELASNSDQIRGGR